QPQQAGTQQSVAKSPGKALARTPDIISDNLDRVAASADQILEVLNKEAGLMVELKRLLAQEAGISGQILEESDLTDVAVAERLRTDMHVRVMATRLVQRYGYLIPQQQARGHDANVQIGAEALCYGNIGQIRLFEDL